MKKKILNLFVATVSCISVLTLTGCTNPIKEQLEHKGTLETASEQMTNMMASDGVQGNNTVGINNNLTSDDGTVYINDVAEFDNGLAVLKDDKTYIIDENFNILWSYDEKYGDERKTQILPEQGEVTIEDLTPNTPMAVFITHQGYLKRISYEKD